MILWLFLLKLHIMKEMHAAKLVEAHMRKQADDGVIAMRNGRLHFVT